VFQNSGRIIGLFIAVAAVFCGVLIWLSLNLQATSNKDVGVLAVKYMYNFSGVGELDNNMEGLKKITSEAVYNELTLDRTDKALNVYLKFNNKPVSVVIEETGPGYVIYSLDTESITRSRKFVFFFETSKSGKIVKAREGELLDFYASNPNNISN